MAKNIFRKTIIIVMLIDIVFMGWFVYKVKSDRKFLVNVKQMVFTNFTEDLDLINSPPNMFKKIGFKVDSHILKEKLTSKILSDIYYLQELTDKINSLMPSIDIAKQIVLSFSKNGGETCFTNISIIEKFKKLPEGTGKGCCVDHSEAFIAASDILGLVAREVAHLNGITGHVTNEYFDYNLSKWIWIDPDYAILARNKKGEYLSLTEIRDMYYRDEAVLFDFFGTKYHDFAHKAPNKDAYYDSKDDFKYITVTWGNNVFRENEFNQNSNFLPKPIRQIIGLVAGIKPSYLMYIDDNVKDAMVIKKRKQIVTFSLLALMIANVILLYSFVRIYQKKPVGGLQYDDSAQ